MPITVNWRETRQTLLKRPIWHLNVFLDLYLGISGHNSYHTQMSRNVFLNNYSILTNNTGLQVLTTNSATNHSPTVDNSTSTQLSTNTTPINCIEIPASYKPSQNRINRLSAETHQQRAAIIQTHKSETANKPETQAATITSGWFNRSAN